ncbi:hypothetical protein [Bradyrhizobium sp. Tv2a-2]|uniref:preATP grasp domain-containing protein n=1 Tax=Bradyrhizobium sp. Tv2a-2 TaxID=113395 RepID=UPI0004223FED|nr:hypothetical protein [Bradyrhizobium sp. Tv2a-2]
MMPRILIMNAGTAQMSGTDLTPIQVSLAAKSAWRSAWFAREDDVIVSPVAVPPDLLNYIGATLKFDPSRVSVIVPDAAQGILNDSTLQSNTIVEKLSKTLRQRSDWTLCACYLTEGVARLAAALGIPKNGDGFALQRGSDLLNRKSHFRQLATSAKLPLASGCVTTGADELFRAVDTFSRETGMVIVKLDNGAGGVGNIILTGEDSAPLPGARETRRLHWSLFEAEALWSEITTPSCKTAIVESYHLARSMFYLEFEIKTHGSIGYMNSGSIRMRPSADGSERSLVWTGLEIPSDISICRSSAAYAHACRFVELVRTLGYRGLINVDAILSVDGQLLFNEANGRWGGGSVLHSIALRLLGPDYSDHYVISSVRNVKSRSLRATIDYLANEGCLFDTAHRQGVIPLADDPETETVECLVIARDRLIGRNLEDRLLSKV